MLLPEDSDLFVYERSLNGQKLFVACNFSEKEREFDFDTLKNGKILINNYEEFNLNNKKLRPFEAVVVFY